jgi:hypothetical protein
MPVSEALRKATAGPDTIVAREAVADAQGVSFTTVSNDATLRAMAKHVGRVAKKRATRRGTSVAAEAPRVARTLKDPDKFAPPLKRRHAREFIVAWDRSTDHPEDWIEDHTDLFAQLSAKDMRRVARECGEIGEFADRLRNVLLDRAEEATPAAA